MYQQKVLPIVHTGPENIANKDPRNQRQRKNVPSFRQHTVKTKHTVGSGDAEERDQVVQHTKIMVISQIVKDQVVGNPENHQG